MPGPAEWAPVSNSLSTKAFNPGLRPRLPGALEMTTSLRVGAGRKRPSALESAYLRAEEANSDGLSADTPHCAFCLTLVGPHRTFDGNLLCGICG